LALLGPAFIAAVAYVDPGNVATNVTAGSRYAYRLVWVVVLANVCAALTQYLAAKLGIATGRSLAALCRDQFPRPVCYLLWVQAEAIAVATDVAEILGGAIGLHLLFGTPLLAGGVISGLVSFALLIVQNWRGQQVFERMVAGLLGCIALGFGYTALVSRPRAQALASGLVPTLPDRPAVILAAAIMGATIMPHAIYLHTGLIWDRFGSITDRSARQRLLTASRRDVSAAMLIAGAVNITLIVVGAGALSGSGIATIGGAHAALGSRIGSFAALAFAVALLVSGLVSSSVGTYAGSMILSGFTSARIPIHLRRLLTLVPALVVLASRIDPTEALVLSQVVLSFGIPFALWPLVWFTSRRWLMGDLVNRCRTSLAGALIATLVTVLGMVTVLVGG
jgi:manganese transport protein